MRRTTIFLIPSSLLYTLLRTCEGFNIKSFADRQIALRNLNRNKMTSSDTAFGEEFADQNFSVVIGKKSDLKLDIDGTLTFSSSLLVEGSLSGRLKCLSYNSRDTYVKIGVEGELRADVKCVAMVEVLGRLTGDVYCKHLIVREGAEVVGNVTTETM